MSKIIEFKVPPTSSITVIPEYDLEDAGCLIPLPTRLRLLERQVLAGDVLSPGHRDLLTLTNHLLFLLGDTMVSDDVYSHVSVRTRSDLKWEYDIRIDLHSVVDKRRVAIETAMLETPVTAIFKRPENEDAVWQSFFEQWFTFSQPIGFDGRVFLQYGNRDFGFGYDSNKFTLIRRISTSRSVITCFEFL